MAGALLAAPLATDAQQPARLYRIGFLGPASASGSVSEVDAFRAGLHDLGYVEGKNIVIEYRWADGKYDRLPELAAELVRLKVDILLTYGTPGTVAAKRATTTIPIVMATVGDAVTAGLVTNLARPEGNVTGLTFLIPELSAKRLELLKNAMPRITQVAVLLNPDNPFNFPMLQAMGIAARSLKVGLQKFEVRGPDEFAGAFAAMAKGRIDAVVIYQDAMFVANDARLVNLAAKQGLPSIGGKEFAKAGGLIGYGADFQAQFRRASIYVDKILKGAKPGDLPIEQPTKFDLVINMKTAKALGIKLPQSVLTRVDEVIQ
ncbi:MAG: ABC transporter substrate-binding protein [Betaproteobacteria bacterium]|nr:ABC transporter substrate-binding protein [Betaproteobacteria bacterium]